MIQYSKIWEEIDADGLPSGAVVRRVLPELVHDCHIGAWKPSGDRWLELDLRGPLGDIPMQDPSTHGLDVTVVQKSKSNAIIRLAQRSPAMSQQFFDVVADVLAVLASHPGDGAATKVVERLLSWREFFARGRESLSADAAAGLFAELTILQEFVAPLFEPVGALAHWTGPDPARQDFQFARGAIEVKSWRGTGVALMQITSEDQLDTAAAGVIVVALVKLDQRKDGPGPTLGDRIDEVRQFASQSATASLDLENKVLAVGWRDDLRSVRSEHYAVLNTEFFDVRDSFPRLIPSVLPQGVGRVRYSIDRSALDEYVLTPDAALARLELARG